MEAKSHNCSLKELHNIYNVKLQQDYAWRIVYPHMVGMVYKKETSDARPKKKISRLA